MHTHSTPPQSLCVCYVSTMQNPHSLTYVLLQALTCGSLKQWYRVFFTASCRMPLVVKSKPAALHRRQKAREGVSECGVTLQGPSQCNRTCECSCSPAGFQKV